MGATIIVDSEVINSTVTDSSLYYSYVEDTVFCATGFYLYGSSVVDNVLTSGFIQYANNTYFAPRNLNDICALEPPSVLGGVVANPNHVQNGRNITFVYSGGTGYTVRFAQSEVFQVDYNATQNLTLNDNGTSPDQTLGDAIYTGIHFVSDNNNQSDGNKTLVLEIDDSVGNNWTLLLNVTLDNTNPNASMALVGSSAGQTNSQSINIEFSTADNLGIERCRFANDDGVYGDWRDCISPISWILNSTQGNRTVYMQVEDVAGNSVVANGTIEYNASFGPSDTTAPFDPSVFDDGVYTNNANFLHFRFNSTDPDTSSSAALQFEYRLLNNSVAFTSFVSVDVDTEVSIFNMSLINGSNYTAEVRATNADGLVSGVGVSDGIVVDGTPPTAPVVASSHSSTGWTRNNIVEFNWSSIDNISGIEGYSYVLDANPSGSPDDILEIEAVNTLWQAGLNNGVATVLKYNASGNATTVATEVMQNPVAGDILRITLQLGEDTIDTSADMHAFVYVMDDEPSQSNSTASNISTIYRISEDVSYKEDIEEANEYVATIELSQDITDDNFFVVVQGDENRDGNFYNFLIGTSSNPDNTTQSFSCGEADACTNTTNSFDYGITVEKSDVRNDNVWDANYTVGDGEFWFHVKAQDKAENFGNATSYKIRVDQSAPSTPQIAQPEQTTNSTTVTFNWTASIDIDSGIADYYLVVSNSSSFTNPEYEAFVGNVTGANVVVSGAGTYYARVFSQNLAGVNSSSSDTVSTLIDNIPPGFLLTKPKGTVGTEDITIFVVTDETAQCRYAIPSAGTLSLMSFTNKTHHEHNANLAGQSTIRVRCTDAIGNSAQADLNVTYSAGSVPSSLTFLPSSLQAFSGEIVEMDVFVRDGGSTLLGEVDPNEFKITIDGFEVENSIQENGFGNYTALFAAPGVNMSYPVEVEVESARANITLNVDTLTVSVQYSISGNADTVGSHVVSQTSGNTTSGVAAEGVTGHVNAPSNALLATANANQNVYFFFTRESAQPDRQDDLLKIADFLKKPAPTFGFSDTSDFIAYVVLQYDDLLFSYTGEPVISDDTLAFENFGANESNKTLIEVRQI